MRVQRMGLPLGAVLTGLIMGGAQCPTTGTPDAGPVQSSTQGCGDVTAAGTTSRYGIVPQETELYLLVKLVDRAGCGFFHTHAIKSLATRYEFTFDRQNPAGGTFRATVFSSGLDPDRDEYRQQFPETQDRSMTDDERAEILVSVREQVEANRFSEMSFTATDLSTLEGAGTAPVEVNLKGQTSVFTMQANAEWQGDKLVITGTGTFNGRPHNVPVLGGAGADCVDPMMEMKMKLTMAPSPECNVVVDIPDAGPPYVAQRFDPTTTCPQPSGTDPQVAFDTVDPVLRKSPRDILLQRCTGCHANPPRLAATIPLVSWEDFRFDSARQRGEPIIHNIKERLLAQADPLAENAMPPTLNGDADLMPPEETAYVIKWIDQGGHEVACQGGMPLAVTQPTPIAEIAPAACAPFGVEDWGEIQGVFGKEEDNGLGCASCHTPQTAPLSNFEPASVPTDGGFLARTYHEFYKSRPGGRDDAGVSTPGLYVWHAALLRLMDDSMPPGEDYPSSHLVNGQVPDGGPLFRLRRWVQAGFPRDGCPDITVRVTAPMGDGGVLSGMQTVRWSTTVNPNAPDAGPLTARVFVKYGGLGNPGEQLTGTALPNTGSYTFDSTRLFDGDDYVFRVSVTVPTTPPTVRSADSVPVRVRNPLPDGGPRVGTPLRYETDIKPILTQYCVPCHSVPHIDGGVPDAPVTFRLGEWGTDDGGIGGAYSRRKRVSSNVQADTMPPMETMRPHIPADGGLRQMVIDWAEGGGPR